MQINGFVFKNAYFHFYYPLSKHYRQPSHNFFFHSDSDFKKGGQIQKFRNFSIEFAFLFFKSDQSGVSENVLGLPLGLLF